MLKSKEKLRILRFHILWKFNYRRKTCGAKRSRSFTASLGVERARKPSAYFFGTFFRTSEKSTYVLWFARHKLKHTNSEPSKNLSSFTPLFSEKKRTAKRRCNFHGRASKNGKVYSPRKQARFRAINASTKTQSKF